jgi:PAS domain S-box-containing protein
VKYADGVFSDITERKRSLEDLERIFSLSGYMVAIADLEGHFKKISPTFPHVLGYSPEDLLSHSHLDFIHPDDKARTIAAIEEVLSTGTELIGFENRYRCKDGGYKWLRWSSRSVVEEGLTFAIAHDITERKLAEEEVRAANEQLAASEQELRDSRHLLDATINNSPAVIYVKDLEGRHLLVNKSYEKVIGKSSKEMLGETDEAFFPKEVAEKLRTNDLLALESDAPLEFEEMALHASGKMHTYMSTKFALRNEDGTPYAICGISADITQRKRVEDAIERIVSQGASSLGQEFLDGMAKQLCEVLVAHCSLIGETVGEQHNRIRTRSVCCDGEIEDNFEYDLAGTPCGNVFGQKPCSYPKDVCKKFPEDDLLKEMDVDGYVGVPLFGSQGEAIGIMAALFRDEVENVEFTESILELFAARTVGEIIRMHAEEAVKERLAFETLVAGLSGKFVNLPSDLVDKEIKEGIRQIVEFLGVDRGGILEFSEDQSELYTTHVYAAAGIEPVPIVDVAGRFPWLTEQLRRGETVCVFRPEELPEEAEPERRFIREQGQKGFFMTPLRVGGSILGALTVGGLQGEHSWSDETVLRLQLVGGIFGNALMRMRTENALRESEERYRAVVEDQTELICRNLPDSTLTFVNDAYCRYFGKSREELIGRKFMPAIPEEDRQKVINYFARLNRDNPVSTHEHRVIMPDGEIRWNQWTNRVILDDDGNIFGFQGVGRDITERKRLEDQERRHQEQLIHFSRLTVAGELASGMAHELNQPLTAITTYAQACQRLIDSGRFNSPKIREAAGEIAAQQDCPGVNRSCANAGEEHWSDFTTRVFEGAPVCSCG